MAAMFTVSCHSFPSVLCFEQQMQFFTAGSDGAIWFTESPGKIGRIKLPALTR